ncbi:MAG: OmpA family protein [Acidobacteriota bacterium]|nr:OmpA family protein [Acidobacteriota bacterium]
MATEKVKVYEEQTARKGTPIWWWLLPLLLLLILAIWWFSRSHREVATTAAPVADQTKPDNGQGTQAPTPGTQTLTAASIGDAIRRNGRISLDDTQVHFATDSAALAGDSQAVLDQVAQALKDNGNWKMRVVGHTDSTGNSSANDALAQQRAQSVMAYLTNHGVDSSHLRVEAEGQHQPVATNSSDNGRALNRRVELIKD